MNKVLAFVALACVALVAATAADSPQGPSKDVPELKVLSHWVGAWDTELTVKPNAGSPGGVRAKGTATAEWVLDGRFVQETWTFDPGDGTPPLSGSSMMTYDARAKLYRTWMFLSNGVVLESEGRWDEKSRTLTSTSRAADGGGPVGTVTATFAADRSQSWSSIDKDGDGKVVGEMSGKNTPRKE